MQKLVKNWIFTLIVCILLAMFAVLLVIDNMGLIGERYFAHSVIHVLTAVALVIYIVLALCPQVPRYKNNSGRFFLLAEIAILLITAVAQVGVELVSNIPLLSKLQVWSVLALAVWLRVTVLTVRAYMLQGIVPNVPLTAEPVSEATPAATAENAPAQTTDTVVAEGSVPVENALVRVPLWRVCLYLLLGALAVWQIVTPSVEDKHFVFGLAATTAVFATIFAVFTVQNQKEWRKTHPKKVRSSVPVSEETGLVPVETPAAEPVSEETPEGPVVPPAEIPADADAESAAKA